MSDENSDVATSTGNVGGATVTGAFIDGEFNDAGGLVWVEAALDMSPNGRYHSATAYLQTRDEDGEVDKKGKTNREDGVELEPKSEPTRVTFDDVIVTPAAEGQVLELVYGDTVVARATYDELRQVIEGTLEGEDEQPKERVERLEGIEARVARLDARVTTLEDKVEGYESSEDTSDEDTGGVTAANPDTPQLADLLSDAYEFVGSRT